MNEHYIRPYVPGSITNEGWTVICVPGMQVAEVVEPLASNITRLLLDGRAVEAKTLMIWFGGRVEGERPDAEAR